MKRSVPAESLPLLKELSQFVDEIANVRPNPRLPWVGAAAFSHKGGTHVNAVQKVLRSYEHIDPALVGNSRHVLISDLAGRSNIVMKARELGFDVTKDTPELSEMLKRVKALEHEGYEFEAADGSLALLIRRCPQRGADTVSSSTRTTCRFARKARRRCAKPTVKVHVGRERRPHGRRGRRPGQRARWRAPFRARESSTRI